MSVLQRLSVWWFNLTHFWRQKCPIHGVDMICAGWDPYTTYHRCPRHGCKFNT